MGYGLTDNLLAIGLVVFVLSAWIASRELPPFIAILLAAIRTAIPVYYFARYSDGSWTLFDDVVYWDQGQWLIENGYSPISALSSQGIEALQALAGGRHVLYVWWNLTAQWLFGPDYFSPVICNVAISFLAGHLLVQLLKDLGATVGYRRFLYVFYLLHWDTIAWTSFLNLKDMIVQLLTICMFLAALRCVRRRSIPYAAVCFAIFLSFQTIRFYLPFLIAFSGAIWLFLEWKDARKYFVLAAGGVAAAMIAPSYRSFMEWLHPSQLTYGMLRFLLTPQPWSVLPSYSFLKIPSFFHWLMFLPSIGGAIMLWRDSRIARLILIYAAVLVLFYSVVDSLQGVRQRSQISFVFAWLQMHFLWRWKYASAARLATSREAIRRPAQARSALRDRRIAPSRPSWNQVR